MSGSFLPSLWSSINHSLLGSRGASIVMKSNAVRELHVYARRVYQALGKARTKQPAPPLIQLRLLLAPVAVCTAFSGIAALCVGCFHHSCKTECDHCHQHNCSKLFHGFSPLKNQIWFLSADSNAVSERTETKFVDLISRC